MSKIISIITVCYNAETHIERLLYSIHAQNNIPGLEHVIVDGNSSDRTCEIILNFAAENNNIVFISEKDNGIYDAMNKGISIASGSYLLFLNSDDYLYPSRLELFTEKLKERQYDLVIALTDILNFDGVSALFMSRINLAKYNFSIPHPSTLIRRDFIIELNGYNLDYKYASDKDFFIRCVYEKSAKIDFQPIVLSAFSQGGAGSRVGFLGIYENLRIDLNHFGFFFSLRLFALNLLRFIYYRIKGYFV